MGHCAAPVVATNEPADPANKLQHAVTANGICVGHGEAKLRRGRRRYGLPLPRTWESDTAFLLLLPPIPLCVP